MRNVLLATTALVAVTGVTAAHADISISGNIEFEYETTEDADAVISTDGQIVLEYTMTADNGVTYGVRRVEKAENAAAQDEFNASISSADIGTIILGNHNDNGPGMIDGSLGRNNDIESERHAGGDWETALSAPSGDMITYVSPSFGGLTVAASYGNDDETAVGARYKLSGVEVYFGSTEDEQNVGIKTSIAGFTLGVGSKNVDGSSAKSNDVALKYTLDNGITLAALNASGTDADGDKTKYNNFGAKYTIAPGVAMKIETGDADNTKYTYVSFDVNF